MDKIPIKINPCPIKEAVIEIRFTSSLPEDAVFGVIYSKISSNFSNIKKLPILQIPEAIRSKDPNLMYNAHYSLSSENNPVQLNIGPHAITFVNIDNYIGWTRYFDFLKQILEKIDETKLITKPHRIGLRYINYFDFQILEKINLNISINNNLIKDESTVLRTEFLEDNYTKVVNVSNNIPVKIQNQEKIGSLIDIDCIYKFNSQVSNNYNYFLEIIDKGHIKEKETFFSLLQKDFLNSLNPQY